MLKDWWVLGRTVSLSPLEIAKAFCAPLMERAGHIFTVREILREFGQVWVQYQNGVMVYDTGTGVWRGEGQTLNGPDEVKG